MRKEWWAKGAMPTYNEVAHTPLFVWDPRVGEKNIRRNSLVQTIDIAPTLLEFFNQKIPDDMQGKPLKNTIVKDEKIRDFGMFGFFGNQVNVTDGRYVYMRTAKDVSNEPIFSYTLMPTDMHNRLQVNILENLELQEPFKFTKGVKTLKLHIPDFWNSLSPIYKYGHSLFDLEEDPEQVKRIKNNEIELELIAGLINLMKENDAPLEQFERLGLPLTTDNLEIVLENDEKVFEETLHDVNGTIGWNLALRWQYWSVCNICKDFKTQDELDKLLINYTKNNIVTEEAIHNLLKDIIPKEKYPFAIATVTRMKKLQ